MKISTPLPSSFNKRRLIYYLISYTFFVVTAIYFICYTILNTHKYLDDDMASEMVLAKLVAENKTILVKDWYYSTELRIFYMQLFMAPLFYFTSNWYLIRVIATIMMAAVLILSLFFFMCAIQQKPFFPIMGSLFLLPFSSTYFYIVLSGLYYNTNLVCAFIIFGLLFYTLRTERKKLKYTFLGLLVVMSFITGLCGTRNLVNIFIPAFASTFLLWLLNLKSEKAQFWKKAIILSLIMFTAGTIGTAVYSILTNIYGLFGSVLGYKNTLTLRFNPKGPLIVLNSFLIVLGLDSRLSLLLLLILIIMIFTALKRSSNLNDGERFITILFVVGLIIYTAIATYTQNLFESYQSRYMIQISIFVFFIIAGVLRMLFNLFPKPLKIFQLCCFSLIFGSYLFNCFSIAQSYNYADTTRIKEVINVLDEHQCYTGYGIYNASIGAGFLNMNVMTELSNGKISVRKTYGVTDNTNIDTNSHWLTQKSLYETKPQGKIFVIFEDIEYETFAIAQYFTNLDYLVMNENGFKLFIYDSYDEMVTVTGVEHRF